MAPRLPSLKRSLLLSGLVVLTVFSAAATAQGPQDPNAGKKSTQQQQPPSSTSPQAPAKSSTQPPNTSSAPVVISNTNTGPAQTSSTSVGPPPSITGTGEATGGGGIATGLPKLTNTPIIISYPPPSVPPTADAPFMQRSSAPDGTVFIAVGAILGAFGAAIVIWRGIIACLLHRSVERAAQAQQHDINDKASFPAPPAPFYKYTDRDSSPSLGVGGSAAAGAAGAAAGRGVRRTNRGPTPSATPSQTNLFFSPTAVGGAASVGAGNRDSRFLPSGFYASANSAGTSPSPNPAQQVGHGHSISLNNLRPDSRGQYGALSRVSMREPSPPDSPQFGAQRRGDASTSSLNLNRPPSGRAPSAFLDDLLDENPEAFPPQGGMPMTQPGVGSSSQGPMRHAHNYSHSSLGRY